MKIFSPIPSLIPAVVDSSKEYTGSNLLQEECFVNTMTNDGVMVDSAQKIQQDMMLLEMEEKSSSQIMAELPLDFIFDLCEQRIEKLVKKVQIELSEIGDCVNQVYELLLKQKEMDMCQTKKMTERFLHIDKLIENKSRAIGTKTAICTSN
jgi:hypothetical protein